MTRSEFPRLATALAAVALLAAASAASGAPRKPRPTPVPATGQAIRVAPVTPVAGQAGLRIQIDPVTGMFVMPAAEPDPVGAAALLPPRESLPVDLLPGGVKRVRLDERFMEYAVIHIGADGSRRFECVHGLDAASARIAAPRPAVPAVRPAAVPQEVTR